MSDTLIPYAFTAHGVAMLSRVLHSDTSVEVHLASMRAFVQLRELQSTHTLLARRFDALEKKYDENFRVVFEAIRQLMAPPSEPAKKLRIGFKSEKR